ncbi:MAG TPA: (Fe-S)-binding protein [Candidatus Deferrimicrobium sp.]|nr:(Fe-S)-binding protein [Candidatus Deferrimicrobium sp.]
MDEFIDPFLEIKIQKVLRYLPCSDCGDCGVAECFIFAKDFINGSIRVCPHLTPYEHELLFLLINYKDFLYPLARRYIKEKKAKKSTIIGLIKIGNPDRNSPVILASNLLYEQSILNSLLKSAKISCYLLAVDTQGVSIGEALLTLSQQISIYAIKEALDQSHLEDLVNHKYIIIPRFGAYLTKSFEKISNWKIFPGPIHISELPIFIERKWYGRLSKQTSANILRILKLMPEQNCGECGFPTCFEFLRAVQQHKAEVERCSLLITPPYKYLRIWLENRSQPIQKYETGVAIDSNLCIGCGICAMACPANIAQGNSSDSEKAPLFKIINGTASIINYKECWRHKYLIPCQICQNSCSHKAISFGPIPVYYEPTQHVSNTSH